jgi:hypothetical protein
MAQNTSTYRTDPAQELATSRNHRFAAIAAYEKILNERNNELFSVNEKCGPMSEHYKSAKESLQKAQGELERIHSVVRRPLNKHRVRWIYFAVFALALALLEAPVNKYLFDVALNGSSFVSYTVSVAFAFFVLVLAHVAGRSIRQVWSEYRRKVLWTSLALFLLLSFVLAGIVAVLTVGRASTSAVSELSNFTDLLSNVRSNVTSLGLWGTVAAAFSDISALVLATVNIGAIFMTMMLAFFTVDPDKDFDAAASEVEKHETLITKLYARYIREKKAVLEKHAPDLAGHSANYTSANGKVIELKTKLGMPIEDEDRMIIDLRDTLSEDAERDESTVDISHEPTLVAGRDMDPTAAPVQARSTPRVVSGDRI